jgi:KUP system potassium uptake protein
MSTQTRPTSQPEQRAAPQADAAGGEAESHVAPARPTGRYLALLAFSALGVVYGDIGTSPLYALRESFHGPHGIAPTPFHIFGVLSLVFWSLIIVITIKYIGFIMRADNGGEGGILARNAGWCCSASSAPPCSTATA